MSQERYEYKGVTIPDKLRKFDKPVGNHESLLSNQAVDFQDLQALAFLGEKNEREYTLSSFRGGSYNSNKDASYLEAGFSHNAWIERFDHERIYFADWGRINAHTHPIRLHSRPDGSTPTIVLPSGGPYGGDFASHASYLYHGGSLNVASPYGLSLYVGINKINNEIYQREIGWHILSGSQQGLHFLHNTSDTEHGLGKDKVVSLEHRSDDGLSRHFIFASWEIIEAIEKEGIKYQDICFGDQLSGFLGKLEKPTIATPYTTNNLYLLHQIEMKEVQKIRDLKKAESIKPKKIKRSLWRLFS